MQQAKAGMAVVSRRARRNLIDDLNNFQVFPYTCIEKDFTPHKPTSIPRINTPALLTNCHVKQFTANGYIVKDVSSILIPYTYRLLLHNRLSFTTPGQFYHFFLKPLYYATS